MRDLTKVEVAGLGTTPYGSLSIAGGSNGDHESKMIAQALKMPGLRSQIESLFYENNRCVSRIDPDIAVLRSFSLNAKIAFQRQRNVASDMEQRSGWDYPYRRIMKLVGLG